jgi:hypothetical protein
MKRLLLLVSSIIVICLLVAGPVGAKTIDEVIGEIAFQYPKWNEYYEPHIFDCSNMAEYVKDKLIEANIDAKFCWSPILAHAWVEVINEGDTCYIIEATTLKIAPVDYKTLMMYAHPPDIVMSEEGLPESEYEYSDFIGGINNE